MKTSIKTKTQLINRLDKAQIRHDTFYLTEYTYVYTKTKLNNPCLYKFDSEKKLMEVITNVERIKSIYKASKENGKEMK